MRRLLVVAVAFVAALGFAQPLRAETFDVSVFHTESDVFAEQYKYWIAEVEKQTQGRVRFKSHYSGALTSIVETYNAVRNGVVPVGLTAPSFVAGAIPSLAYLEALGSVPNDAEGTRKASDAIQPFLTRILPAHGVEYLWWQPGPGLLLMCRDKHLKRPEDWTGLKVRAAGRWQSAQMAAMGASPVATDPAEQYIALQNRTVDCALNAPNLAVSLKLYEVAKKLTVLNMRANGVLYIMHPQAWKQIAPADQALVRKVGLEAMHRSIVYVPEFLDKMVLVMKERGAEPYHLTDAELKVAKQRMQAVYSKIGEAAGEQGKALAALLQPYW
jgi:TRAP-type C4-dicarboxylate transport system substrate-binding protein